jgi:DNA-binding NtrC family response regulator
VRIVGATNRNLEQEVEAGRFRRDLLYRLNVVQVRIPALRERASDIPDLVRAIFDRNGADTSVTDRAMRALLAYSWPGNVRELQHCVERLAALRLNRVDLANLPREIRRDLVSNVRDAISEPRLEVEHALRAANGNITHAAKALGLTRHGLKKRMTRLGMRTDIKGPR